MDALLRGHAARCRVIPALNSLIGPELRECLEIVTLMLEAELREKREAEDAGI